MLILLGYPVVLGTVFGGYMMTGGHLGALYQPAELVIIGGAGVGAFIVGNNGKSIKGTLKAIPLLFRRSKYTKSMYMDLLALLYRLMAKSRQQGMFSLERDIENPKESEIFASYPRILADAMMLDFIVDYLRLIISGNMNTFEIEALMDEEIETHERIRSTGQQRRWWATRFRRSASWRRSWALFMPRPRRIARRLNWGADCPRDGGDVPRYFTGLRLYLPAGERAAPEERRNHQNDAVRENYAALKPQRLCATDCRRIWS